MSDYLSNLVAKNQDPGGGIRPRLLSFFEPAYPSSGLAVWNFISQETVDGEPIMIETAMDARLVAPSSTERSAKSAQGIRPPTDQGVSSRQPHPTERREGRVSDRSSTTSNTGQLPGPPSTGPDLPSLRSESQLLSSSIPTGHERNAGHLPASMSEATPLTPGRHTQGPHTQSFETGRKAATEKPKSELDTGIQITESHRPARLFTQLLRVSADHETESSMTPERAASDRGVVFKPAISLPNFSPHQRRSLRGGQESRSLHEIYGKLSPANNTETGEIAEPTIQVTIGRIEVRATPPTPSPTKQPQSKQPVMSLDDYLRQRSHRDER